MVIEKYCHICYSLNTDDDFICDRCDQYYCEDCSYTFTLHYQLEGNRCYWCSDQKRKKPLTGELKRDLKIDFILKNGNR